MTPRRRLASQWITVSVTLAIALWAADAWAADSFPDRMIRWFEVVKTGFNRHAWDIIMRWVNFLILAVLIYKYAKTPVVQFLKEKRAETALSIEMLEDKKHEAEAKIQESQMQLRTSQERLALIKERIVSEGQKRKEQIIDQAHQESQRLLESAKLKIESQIREAYNTVRLELIDMAAEKAACKLPQVITEKDQQHWVRLWLDTV